MPKLKPFSVMLLYPIGSGEPGDTFYDFVNARDRDDAVARAIKKARKDNQWTKRDWPDDEWQELLVLEGHHQGV